MELITFHFVIEIILQNHSYLKGYGMLVKKLTHKKGLFGNNMILKINCF